MLLTRNRWSLAHQNIAGGVIWKNPTRFTTCKVCHHRSITNDFGKIFAAVSEEKMARPLPPVNRLEAILFDVDGTLADSDPLHYQAFREMLLEEGYNGGEPITEEFFSANISGQYNIAIGQLLFPEWEESRLEKWMDDKEARFRKLAAENFEGKAGIKKFAAWIEKQNLRRAAVTNAPRSNAEQMIAAVGLAHFFEFLVVGAECTRAKPFPDPYLKALDLLGVAAERACVFEDSPLGIKAAVGAQLAVVGVVSGNPASDLLEAGATFAIEDFSDPALWKALGGDVPV